MSKSTERQIPQELKNFNKMFKHFHYKVDANRVFSDLLTIFINFYANGSYQDERDQAMSQYDADDHKVFNQMFYEIHQVFNKMIVDDGATWYDPWGEYYMYLAGQYKQSWFGQFFTPPEVVDMMVRMTGGETGAGKSANDCCCGSGRFLIAYHAHYPGNYCYAEDVDPICCKMTAVNMMMHGCEGEVVCHNSLQPDDYRFGYHINHRIRLFGLPSIIPMSKENSKIIAYWDAKRLQNEKKEIKPTNGTCNEACSCRMSIKYFLR